MHSVRIEPAKLILVGTRITYQATGDAGILRRRLTKNRIDYHGTYIHTRYDFDIRHLERSKHHPCGTQVAERDVKSDLDLNICSPGSPFLPLLTAIFLAEGSKSDVLLQGAVRALFQGFPTQLQSVPAPAHRGFVLIHFETNEAINMYNNKKKTRFSGSWANIWQI